MNELVKQVNDKIRESVGGFFSGVQRTPLVERFLKVREDGLPADPRDDDGLFAYGTHDQTVMLAVQECLDRKRVKGPLPQYEVFRLLDRAAVILNYNTDGLAEGVPQRVHWMHGIVIPGYTARLAEVRFKAYYLTQQGVTVAPQTFLPPVPEPPDYLVANHLDGASRDIANATAVIVVGYSFGLTSDGFDDAASFRMVRDLLRDKQVDVVIVDPGDSGRRLQEALAEETRSRQVTHVPAYWHLLARALLGIARERGWTDLASVNANAVLDRYVNLFEAFERNGGKLPERS